MGLDNFYGDQVATACLTLSHSLTFMEPPKQTLEAFHTELHSQADFPRREGERTKGILKEKSSERI